MGTVSQDLISRELKIESKTKATNPQLAKKREEGRICLYELTKHRAHTFKHFVLQHAQG